jgi:hypothetical protein
VSLNRSVLCLVADCAPPDHITVRSEEARVFVGIDSHKDTLVAAIVDQVGRVGAVASFENHPDGFAQMFAWLRKNPAVVRVGWSARAVTAAKRRWACREPAGWWWRFRHC